MNRTKFSNHVERKAFDVGEKKSSLNYGAEGEYYFLKHLQDNYGRDYEWFSFKDNYSSVDFYGIPKIKGNEKKYDMENGKNNYIVIELKSKRRVCSKENKKLMDLGGNFVNMFHTFNYTKFIDIQKRIRNKTTKKAFVVFDYVSENVDKLSKYDKEIGGNYFFHEIKEEIWKNDEKIRKNCEWSADWEDGVVYNEDTIQNGNRGVEDKCIKIPYDKIKSMDEFRHHLPIVKLVKRPKI